MRSPLEDPLGQQKTTALLVDCHLSASELLSRFLGRESELTVIGEAQSGLEGLRLFRRFRPALVITSLELPELNGPDMILEMQREGTAKYIVYTGCQNPSLIRAAFDTKPNGFIHKSDSLLTLIQGIRLVVAGGNFFSPKSSKLGVESSTEERLTIKERMILQLVAEGLSSKETANQLSLSPKTVEHYRKHLMQKLGLHCVASLTMYAVRCGLVSVSTYAFQSTGG